MTGFGLAIVSRLDSSDLVSDDLLLIAATIGALMAIVEAMSRVTTPATPGQSAGETLVPP